MMRELLLSVWLAATSPASAPPPQPQTLDMLDWTTMDADLRATSHMSGPKHPLYTVVTMDRIWYIKDSSGAVWDVSVYDNDNIWSWITENKWGDPTSFVKWWRVDQVLFAPRRVQAGFPGSTWVLPKEADVRFEGFEKCELAWTFGGPPWGGLGIVHEIWGPYLNVPTWGNIGTVDVVKIVYFYGCRGTTSDTCNVAEVYWFAKRYGLIRWSVWASPRRDGAWLMEGTPAEFFDLVPGTVQPIFPCDSIPPKTP